MSVITGKSGADAIFVALRAICGTIKRYRVKLDAVIEAAATAGAITPEQAALAHDFVASANTTCAVFELVAGYSGIN